MTRFSIAKQRATLFGGHVGEHRNDAGRGGTLGIDECSMPQRGMRIALALALFGDGLGSSRTPLHRLWYYSFAVTPRYDSLDIVARAADNVAQAICAGAEPLPGFRYLGTRDGSALIQHVPTGGLLTISAENRGTVGDLEDYRRDMRLGPDEKAAAARVEMVSANTGILLAALIARLSIDLGDGGYGHLLDYHIRSPWSGDRHLGELRLEGVHNEWLLIAVGAPGLDRIVRALTQGRHGVEGCAAEWYGQDNAVLRVGDAVLAISTLEPYKAMAWITRATVRA